MITSRVFRFLAILFVSQFLTPGTAGAQDCGRQCKMCGISGREGWDHSPTGPYDMNCFNWVPFCHPCPFLRLGAGDSAEDILRRIAVGTDLDARHVIEANPGRLLISPLRRLIALRGSTCDPNEVVSVVYVTAERASYLRQYRLPTLESYVARLRKP